MKTLLRPRRRNGRFRFEALDARRLLSAILHVDASAPGPLHDGSSWDSAYVDLQQALAAAAPGDQIRVADGTYKPTASADRNATLQLISGVSIVGGYAGSGAPDPDARDVTRYRSFLSGDIGSPGVWSDNSIHVVTGSGADATAVLDGVVIKAGNATYPSGRGGGIYNDGGSPTIIACTFTANRAEGQGGAIYNANSSAPTITGCIFTGNYANQAGGGIASASSSAPVVTGCTFTRNYAYEGAGIYGAYDGGASTISDCTFSDNTCQSGGGVFAYGGSATVTRCTFLRNVASYKGGGMAVYGSSGTAAVSFSRFHGNTASSTGGGIDLYNGTVTHCSFVGNSAQAGAGIYLSAPSTSAISNCTITANTSTYGGALGLNTNNTINTAIVNCIVWGNTGAQISPQPSNSTTVTYSDVQNGVSGTGNINVDPRFMRVPAVGNDAVWGTFDDFYGDLRMKGDSFAIDQGSDAAVPAGITTDLAGAPRFVNKPSFGSALVDMGAYESQARMADAGGPYVVALGKTILSAVGTSFVNGALQYAWDFDNDGQFDDAVGSSPILSASALPVPSTLTVAVRVTDAQAQTVVDTATVHIVPEVTYVDPRATGTGDGTSWENARPDLLGAMFEAVHGQEILVATGTYVPSDLGDPTASFPLRSGAHVLGGYAGFGAADPDERDPTAYPTILSGDIGAAGAVADNSLHVVDGSHVNNFAQLSGVIVTSGNADGRYNVTSDRGGGMFNVAGKPTLRDVTFLRNLARDGGAVANRANALPTFIDCVFLGNKTTLNAGAMLNDASSPTIINSLFVGNTTVYGGGAIYNMSSYTPSPTPSQPVITNCTFTANAAQLGGGAAIYDYQGGSILTNSILWGNLSTSGAQIIALYGTSVVSYSDVQGGATGTGNIDADPQFVAAPSSGGDGTWGTPDDDYGDLRLQATSPCLDVGSNAAVPASVVTDFEGSPRIADFPRVNDPGAIADLGAYERPAGAPSVTSATFLFETNQAVRLIFSGNISASLTLGDLQLQDLTTGQNVPADLLSKTGGATQGTWSFAAMLADGNYRATLPAGSISDAYGQPLAADFVFDFFVLAGDANRDRVVDITDLGILATNWQGTNKTFSKGDFNYDGTVDITDLGILATNWQKDLPVPAGPGLLTTKLSSLIGRARASRIYSELAEISSSSTREPR